MSHDNPAFAATEAPPAGQTMQMTDRNEAQLADDQQNVHTTRPHYDSSSPQTSGDKVSSQPTSPHNQHPRRPHNENKSNVGYPHSENNIGWQLKSGEEKPKERVVDLHLPEGDGPRKRKVLPGEENFDGAQDEIDQEDYSLLSFLPDYQKHKRKFEHLKEKYKLARVLRCVVICVLCLLFGAYLLAAVSLVTELDQEDYWCTGDGFLLVVTAMVVTIMFYFCVVKRFWGKWLQRNLLKPLQTSVDHYWKRWTVRLAVYGILLLAVATFLIIDTASDRQRLVSLFGLFVLLLLGFLFSHAPRKVVWRHVIWGVGLQFVMGLIVLRWTVGRRVFECLGAKVASFLAFTDAGSEFLFGHLAVPEKIFAFSVLPVVLFFSFCIQILYYYGAMQWVVMKLGWLLQVTVGTTACESVNAAANIFLGQTEAPLLIKPYIKLMTKSELHAILTGGFATIAGSVMAAFISFGVSPSHLLSASIMSAPAALAYAKLFYPETEKSKTLAKDIQIVKSNEVNALHAAIEGVTQAIPLVANIGANLLAFLAFISFFNAVFNWSCQLVHVEDGVCTLENMFGYVFTPLAWTMGVAWEECHTVGTLIGIKTMVNEFVAYAELSKLIKAGTLSARAEIIATYALCGFSNIGAIGIQLGGLGQMAPERKTDIAKVIVRAMIAGSAACFMTACIAGTLLDANALASVKETAPTL